MDKLSIVDKIRKLLALAGSNANVHEAALAAEHAQRLMMEHKIAQAELAVDEGEDDEPITEMEVIEGGRNVVSWRMQLIASMGTAMFCKVIIRHGPLRWGIIGTASDANTVAYMYQYLTAEIDRLCECEGARRGKAWRNSFRWGAAIEIGQRMRAEHDRQAGLSETALIVVTAETRVSDYLETHHADLPNHRSARPRDMQGLIAGRRAGATISMPGGKKELSSAPKRIGGVR